MLKVSFHRSLAFKLFAFISVVLLITIGMNAWQNGRMFHSQLLHRIQEKTMQSARQTANGADAIIESWVSQVIVITNSISSIPRSKYNDMISTLTAANPEFLAFELLNSGQDSKKIESLALAETKYQTDERFGGTNAREILKKVSSINKKWIAEHVAKKNAPGFIIRNLMPDVGLPILTLALQFKINDGQEGKLWAVLTVWQTKLYGSLSGNAVEAVAIIDQSGDIISSSDLENMRRRRIEMENPIVVEAIKQKAPDGFKDWQDDSGERVLGAFAKIKKFRLIALTESDGAPAYQAVQMIVGKTLLWAALLVLLAMFLSFLSAKGITQHLRELMGTTIKIADGDFKARAEVKSKDEVGLLSLAVNHMAGQLDRLVGDRVEKARLESELQTAKIVQERFFPTNRLDDDDGFQLTSFFQPASECGGDWWGHYKLADGIHLVCIADATGHGVPAALVTAMVFSAASVLTRTIKAQGSLVGAPSKILIELNRTLCESGQGTHTMTFFCAVFDLNKRKVTYSNAGHNFPFLVRGPNAVPDQSKTDRAATKKREQLSSVATPLGVDGNSEYKEKVVPIYPGDRLFLYTDGLFECNNAAGEMWGKRRFLKAIEQHGLLPIEQFKVNMVTNAYSHFAGHPTNDDITVVVVGFAAEAAEALPSLPTEAAS